jgi:hypothetical protein
MATPGKPEPIRDWRDLLEVVFGDRRPDGELPEPWELWPELTAKLVNANLRGGR